LTTEPETITVSCPNSYGHCPAIISELPQGGKKVMTFGQLKQVSNQFSISLSFF
jgi:hypothetical protein